MTFVPTQDLKEGMILGRDLYLYDGKKSKIVMIRSGQSIKDIYIQKLEELDILGAYIKDDAKNKFEGIQSFISADLKIKAITNIKSAFEMFDKASQWLNVEVINQTCEISKQLVDILEQNGQMLLNLNDLKLYDDNTYNHSLGVTILSIAIGLALHLDHETLCDLGVCGLLHDIGKTKIPITIISKPGKLSTAEFNTVKLHPEIGARFLYGNNLVSQRIYDGVLCHHEKFDGTGYPNKLLGEDIPLFGRIITVADVYDALTSIRPYRTPSSPQEAIEYIMGGCGTAFDIHVVRAFLTKVSPYPIGSCLKLSNGQPVIVVKQYEDNPLRPVVRPLDSPDDLWDLYYRRDLQNIVIDSFYKANVEEISS